jgi:hypothetical protein
MLLLLRDQVLPRIVRPPHKAVPSWCGWQISGSRVTSTVYHPGTPRPGRMTEAQWSSTTDAGKPIAAG